MEFFTLCVSELHVHVLGGCILGCADSAKQTCESFDWPVSVLERGGSVQRSQSTTGYASDVSLPTRELTVGLGNFDEWAVLARIALKPLIRPLQINL